ERRGRWQANDPLARVRALAAVPTLGDEDLIAGVQETARIERAAAAPLHGDDLATVKPAVELQLEPLERLSHAGGRRIPVAGLDHTDDVSVEHAGPLPLVQAFARSQRERRRDACDPERVGHAFHA